MPGNGRFLTAYALASVVALSPAASTVSQAATSSSVTVATIKIVETTGMHFYRIPMTTHVSPTTEQLALFLRIVNDPAQQPSTFIAREADIARAS